MFSSWFATGSENKSEDAETTKRETETNQRTGEKTNVKISLLVKSSETKVVVDESKVGNDHFSVSEGTLPAKEKRTEESEKSQSAPLLVETVVSETKTTTKIAPISAGCRLSLVVDNTNANWYPKVLTLRLVGLDDEGEVYPLFPLQPSGRAVKSSWIWNDAQSRFTCPGCITNISDCGRFSFRIQQGKAVMYDLLPADPAVTKVRFDASVDKKDVVVSLVLTPLDDPSRVATKRDTEFLNDDDKEFMSEDERRSTPRFFSCADEIADLFTTSQTTPKHVGVLRKLSPPSCEATCANAIAHRFQLYLETEEIDDDIDGFESAIEKVDVFEDSQKRPESGRVAFLGSMAGSALRSFGLIE